VEYIDIARTFAAYAACFAESIGGERLSPEAVRHRIHGEEHLDKALSGGRGAVLATAHIGAWDLASRWLPSLYQGRTIIVVMASEADASARQLHDRVRTQGGVRVAHLTEDPLDGVTLLGELRRGSLICVQLDRAPASPRTVTVPLFGEPFQMPVGPYLLAALARVALVPIFVARRGFLDYEVDIGAPIELKSRPCPSELEEAAKHAAAHMEQFIRAHPTQWFHFEDR
jgi:KDO2-lipid IV(A) lauroyltransferase